MTVLNWLCALKCGYLTKGNISRIGLHKHRNQHKQRGWFALEYITAVKPRCHRWVQMPAKEFKALPDRHEILNPGYIYTGVRIIYYIH